jgi:acyl-CoA reductase-like NAD-dependent aldehyde dehydrogenase
MRSDLPTLTAEYGLFIDGDWRPGVEHFDVVDPATEERLTRVAQASATDVDAAVAAGRAALADRRWTALPPL